MSNRAQSQKKYRIKMAATKLLRRANKMPPGAHNNACWNAATEAFGYADEGQVTKAAERLAVARNLCVRKGR